MAAFGLAIVAGGTGIASAATPPSKKQLKKIGSSMKAEHTQPRKGVGDSTSEPLIVVSFADGKATILGGSAVSGAMTKGHAADNIPISAVECMVNFTTQKTKLSSTQSKVRWFGGIGCTRSAFQFGQAFLAESSSKFDGTGPYYKGTMQSALSGQDSTIINAPNPSVYIWYAMNIFFQEKPTRGVYVIDLKPGNVVNSASSCAIATDTTYGFGVHCDLYTNRF